MSEREGFEGKMNRAKGFLPGGPDAGRTDGAALSGITAGCCGSLRA